MTYPGLMLAALLLTAAPAWAARMTASVVDTGGVPLEDAVVTLTPSDGGAVQLRSGQGTVDQLNLEFVPYVTVITAGSMVTFPNSDNVRHHVYSFSAAKSFELPLYAGAAAPSVRFDKPGVVPLGCNIHDWMIGYVYVAATPYAARTGRDGKVALDVPAGSYVARVWHPSQVGAEATTQRSVKVDETGQALSWSLELKPSFRIPRRSGGKGFGY
ncbi:MAG: methylamine utilization protein [Sphingomonadales bacterium]